MHPESAVSTVPAATDDAPRYRSGAVARMAGMPVATLRVWERRYRVTMPEATASGQRLYTAADVRRLALIRQLTELGHAIGALATLSRAQLQTVATTHFGAETSFAGSNHDDTQPGSAVREWRLAVVGSALADRLQRPGLLRHLGRPLREVLPFDSLGQAATAIERSPVDALLIHAPTLHPGWQAEIDAAAPGLRALPTAVLYGFAADNVCAELAAAGMRLLREPQNDTVLGQWLRSLAGPVPAHPQPFALAPSALAPAPQRRWNDDTLSGFAALSTTIACECPRHIAELLLQLTRFEDYSAECANRNTADAALHAYLGQVAGLTRAQFETALEQVAAAEGLSLPPG